MATKKKVTTKNMATKNSAAQAEATQALGVLKLVPLDQIDPESFENQRTGDFTVGDSGDNGSSFKELVESIEATGQKDPITIRLKAKGRHGKKVPYEVIKGFRRYAAVKLLAEKDGVKNPMISVIEKQLTDLQALEENIFENTARDNLSGPDLAWAAYKLAETYAASGVKISDNQLAGRMGKNQSYISKLMRIVKQAPKIATEWREAPIPISVDAIEKVSKMAPEAQEEAYKSLLKAGVGKGRVGAGGKATIDIAIAQGKRVATLLGKLQRLGLVTCEINWKNNLEALGVSIKALSGPEVIVVGKETKGAFLEALNYVEPEKKPEAAEEASAGK